MFLRLRCPRCLGQLDRQLIALLDHPTQCEMCQNVALSRIERASHWSIEVKIGLLANFLPKFDGKMPTFGL
jgi:hypothetical protein